MLKRVGIGILVVLIFVLMLWFTNINPGVVTLDLAFGTVQPSIPLAVSVHSIVSADFAMSIMPGWHQHCHFQAYQRASAPATGAQKFRIRGFQPP